MEGDFTTETQSGEAASKYQEWWNAMGLVKAKDAKPNRPKTTWRSSDLGGKFLICAGGRNEPRNNP